MQDVLFYPSSENQWAAAARATDAFRCFSAGVSNLVLLHMRPRLRIIPQWLIIATLFCTASVLLFSRPTCSLRTGTRVTGSTNTHVGVFFVFARSLERELWACFHLQKPKKWCLCQKIIVINGEIRRRRSEMQNVKCRERENENETSKEVKETEWRVFPSIINLDNCAYSTPLWQNFLRNWKMFLTTLSTSLKGCWIWGWTRGVKWTTPTSTYRGRGIQTAGG